MFIREPILVKHKYFTK